MPKFKEILASLGLAPKTLDQAKATIDSTKPALDSVAALFTSAGLDLDSMLAAGPDSLSAHLASLSAKDTELAAAQAKVSNLEGQLSVKDVELVSAKAKLNDLTAQLASVGFNITASQDGSPVDIKTSFTTHVTTQAALILAKDGRPPVDQISPAKGDSITLTRAAWQALEPKKQLEFINGGGKITD